jgi:hypothetical protein|tara:strand:- start:251 stop:874 length:624 start_codon:yes stop_codon:yes gene_type:complete
MACIIGKEFPYASSCEKLRKIDEECLSDDQCELDGYCWYKDATDAKAGSKKCMTMYSAKDYTVYGYKKEPMKKDYNMQENYELGRYCESGIAVITSENEMMCVRIEKVVTNTDKGVDYPDADKCKIEEDDAAALKACEYQYKDEEGNPQTINTEYCECSLMKEMSYTEAGEPIPQKDDLPWLKGGIKPIPPEQIELAHGFCPFPRQK